jgi:histone acetyltransferase 1
MYKNWKPPGELVKTIKPGNSGESNNTVLEIWKGSLSDKPIQQLLKRIQVLVPLFIEGGSLIEMDDPDWSLKRWSIFFLYEKDVSGTAGTDQSPYTFMGYSTVYSYFPLQKLSTADAPVKQAIDPDFIFPFMEEPKLPTRTRISQFVILPPFQGGGNGSAFYETIYQHYLADVSTFEITVEDPNEEFDDLRDLNDLARLRQTPDFDSIRINTTSKINHKGKLQADVIVDKELREKFRSKVKIAPRQFIRLVEMQLLSRMHKSVREAFIDSPEASEGSSAERKAREHEFYLWELFVKQRLYRHNKDQLIQLDAKERITKLDDALQSVEGDYERLLAKLEGRKTGVHTQEKAIPLIGNGKRAASEVYDEEDDAGPASKKARQGDA